MMTEWLAVLVAVPLGGWCGWLLGTPWGIMDSYFSALLGASIGLYLGRRIQRTLEDG